MCPIFLSDTKASWNLSTNFSEIQHDDWHQNLSIWEPSCFMRTDGRMDTSDEINSRFRQLLCIIT